MLSASKGYHVDVLVRFKWCQARFLNTYRKVKPQQHDNAHNPPASLARQLFPDVYQDTPLQTAESAATREVPPLPLDVITEQKTIGYNRAKAIKEKLPYKFTRTQAPGTPTEFLRIDNASESLTIADFRRIIPQGKHLEGWAVEQGDILKVIPGREVGDLSQKTFYYLQFSSAYSAHIYQTQVIKAHDLIRHHAPTPARPVPHLPESYVESGISVSAAIAAYTILSPDQTLYISQLKWPFTSHTGHLLQHGGIEALVARPDKMPFELRLTLEGQQVHPSVLRKIFVRSGKERGMPWSGSQDVHLFISQWQSTTRELELWTRNKVLPKENKPSNDYRSPLPVYVIGFHTEDAAQSFLHYWHKRPLAASDNSALTIGDDIAPIVQVEALW